ncbi:MAG: pilin [Pseudomonadota bacterium]|nr:pilin [Pseudomonadota bacterium]
MTEGIGLADAAKTAVAEAYQSGDMKGVTALAASWIPTASATKYVTSVTVGGTGLITVAYSAIVPQISGKTLVLQPFIGNAVLATNLTGSIDWGCGTLTAKAALANGLTLPTLGNLDGRYSPASCK